MLRWPDLLVMGLFFAAFVLIGVVVARKNKSASTITTDFYRRLFVRNRDERHYLAVGRRVSCLLGAIMIGGALLIHYASTEMLQDLQILVQSISGGGLLALTLLGMLTVRVDNRAALIAVATGFGLVCAWLFVDSSYGHDLFPNLAARLPDKFWMHVIVNLFVLALGFGLSAVLPNRRRENLTGLTVWTKGTGHD